MSSKDDMSDSTDFFDAYVDGFEWLPESYYRIKCDSSKYIPYVEIESFHRVRDEWCDEDDYLTAKRFETEEEALEYLKQLDLLKVPTDLGLAINQCIRRNSKFNYSHILDEG